MGANPLYGADLMDDVRLFYQIWGFSTGSTAEISDRQKAKRHFLKAPVSLANGLIVLLADLFIFI